MKKITQLLSALVFCSLMIFISCGGDDSGDDDPVDARDQQAALLVGGSPWTVTSAELDDETRADWEGVTLSFTYDNESDQGTYTVSNVPDEQPDGDDEALVLGDGSVDWSFAGATSTGTIQREDGGDDLSIQASESELTIQVTVTGATSRVAGFNGQWEFELSSSN